MEDRKITLLKACMELMSKQNDSPYVLNILEETVNYDGVECDGECLLEDIKDYLIEIGELEEEEYE